MALSPNDLPGSTDGVEYEALRCMSRDVLCGTYIRTDRSRARRVLIGSLGRWVGLFHLIERRGINELLFSAYDRH